MRAFPFSSNELNDLLLAIGCWSSAAWGLDNLALKPMFDLARAQL